MRFPNSFMTLALEETLSSVITTTQDVEVGKFSGFPTLSFSFQRSTDSKGVP